MESKQSSSRCKDPFAEDPLPKAYYHPSPKKRLSKSQRATSIEARRRNGEYQESKDDEVDQTLNPVDEMFLHGANIYQSRDPGQVLEEDNVNFDETWPSSERPSSISLTGFDEDILPAFERYRSTVDQGPPRERTSSEERLRMPGSSRQGMVAVSSGKGGRSRIPVLNNTKKLQEKTLEEENGSVLKKYIDRFRNSEPMSREEREQASEAGSQDFWWLKEGKPGEESAGSFRRKKGDRDSESSKLTKQNMEKYEQWKGKGGKKPSRDYIPESPGDKRTIELQERAERLLERSSSTVLSTEPAVSTEGLGSTMSDMSSIEEYSYRPKFASYLEPRVKPAEYVAPLLPGQRPPAEDDPLFQWRLRRRMELAQQAAPTQNVHFDFLSKSEQQKQVDSKLEEFKQRLASRVPSKSQVQFTPAPVQQQLRVSVPHCESSESTDYRDPPIASPSLHPPKLKSQPFEEVDPHLHLMCDLLPCPHRGRYQLDSDVQGTSAEIRKGGDSEKLCNKLQNSVSKESDTSKYKQYLEAEKPDDDRVGKAAHTTETAKKTQDVLHSDSPVGTESHGEQFSEKNSVEEIEQMVKNIGSKETSRKVEREEESEKMSGSVKEREEPGDNEIDTKFNVDSSQSQTRVTQKQKVKSDKQVENRGLIEDKDVRKSEREKVLKPQHSSSPKNGRTVSAAIGQAIKEHLFSVSTSTVLSSVESLPPSASAERLPWKQKARLHDQLPDTGVKVIEEEDVHCESDGEFPDDGLLMMLRRQRAMYEQQLQEIDNMLYKLEEDR